MSVSLFIAGDFAPKSISPEKLSQKGTAIFSEIKPFIEAADLSIVNLEAPLVKKLATPIQKSGPNLMADPITAWVLKNAGFDIVTLANNHFFDQGQNGVDCTINECQEQSIHTVGGGKTYSSARLPLVCEKNGKRIAIINACENEFSIANADHGGSNPIDLVNMHEDIDLLRSNVDYLIVILHGGVEHYYYPTPRMKRWYHHFVDLGADAVINHHQHCINGYEIYKGKPIFYGLGNFYFPWIGEQPCPESWNYGYAVQLFFDDKISFELIPYKQTIDGITLRNIFDFKKEMELLSIPISDDYLLQQKFNDYIIDREYYIKSRILPSFLFGRILLALARRGYLGKLYHRSKVLSLKNTITCESHHEILQQLFKILSL